MPQPTYTIQLAQQINQIILNGSDPQTVLQQTAQTIGEAFHADGCLITVAELDFATDYSGYWQPDCNLPLLPQQILALRQLATTTQARAEPLAINDIHAVDPRLLTSLPHLPVTVKAILTLPTRFQSKENGLISLTYSQPHYWNDLEIAAASDFAAAVAIAISHISQTATIAALQHQVHTSAKYRSLINQLTIASRGSSELEQIFQSTLAGAAQVLQVDRGLILTLKYADPPSRNRERREKIPQARVKVADTWLHDSNVDILGSFHNCLDYSFWLSECLLCQRALTNSPQAVVVTDQTSLAAIAPMTGIEPVFAVSALPALLMFPLESQGTVIGFLVLQQVSDRRWHDEELALVELVAAMVSTAIIQSQTLRQVQSLVDERTSQLQRSLEVQGKLYEKTRQQIDQLRHLNQLKDEFVSTMNHELRTPLTSMSLAIRMLRQPELSAERQAKYLNILEQQCNQEIQLIHDLLKLQEVESNKTQLKLETINLKSKLSELAQAFIEKWAAKGLTITVDVAAAVLQVQTDADSIDRILQELLTNAGKYSHPNTNVTLKATHQIEQQSSQLVISLTNTGTGIASEDLNYIFDKFHRGQGVTQQAIQGTGLGLALVKCLVQQLNGTIDVSSIAIKDGSSHEICFTLSLPQSFILRSILNQS